MKTKIFFVLVLVSVFIEVPDLTRLHSEFKCAMKEETHTQGQTSTVELSICPDVILVEDQQKVAHSRFMIRAWATVL